MTSKRSPWNFSVEDLDGQIQFMHERGFIHRKRKYVLNTATIAMASAHTLEEFAEYNAACVAFEGQKLADKERGLYEGRLEEAADLLACFLHQNQLCGLTIQAIANRAIDKMKDIFIDPCTGAGKALLQEMQA